MGAVDTDDFSLLLFNAIEKGLICGIEQKCVDAHWNEVLISVVAPKSLNKKNKKYKNSTFVMFSTIAEECLGLIGLTEKDDALVPKENTIKWVAETEWLVYYEIIFPLDGTPIRMHAKAAADSA